MAVSNHQIYDVDELLYKAKDVAHQVTVIKRVDATHKALTSNTMLVEVLDMSPEHLERVTVRLQGIEGNALDELSRLLR